MSDKADAGSTPDRAEIGDRAHGALMDAVYRRQRYIYDATRKYFLLGRDRLIDELKPGAGDRVLEIGCGTGRNLILAARRYPKARFYGFDISENMLETARAKVAAAGVADRIELAQGDAAAFDVNDLFGGPMDRAFLSYAISMIPPWRAAIDRGVAALADGGSLHIVDFGQLERLPRPAKAVLDGWLARFHVEPRADLKEALEAAANAAGRRADFTPLYRGYAWLGRIG